MTGSLRQLQALNATFLMDLMSQKLYVAHHVCECSKKRKETSKLKTQDGDDVVYVVQ